jgi:hypothetical protein
MGEKSAEHPALAEITTLRLASPDGTLSCRQNNGNSCTAEQVRSLNEHVAAEMRCEIRFEDSRSNAANATDPHPNKTSDIAAKVEAWERSLNQTNPTSESTANGQAPEGTLNTTSTTSDSTADGQVPERTLNTTAKDLERERTERRMNATTDIAAKERERELERQRAERRMNALSQGAAKGQGSAGAKNSTSTTPAVAAGGQGSVEPKTQGTKPLVSPPKSASTKAPNRG